MHLKLLHPQIVVTRISCGVARAEIFRSQKFVHIIPTLLKHGTKEIIAEMTESDLRRGHFTACGNRISTIIISRP